jgi:hypothetical protein
MQIVGKSFRTPDAFAKYVDGVTFNIWRPRFVVVHNTSAPDLKNYADWQTHKVPVTDEQWARNLKGYYEGLGWSAGPHLFVTPKSIIVFSPLNARGTHTPSWNSISWGVETVGEFQRDPFDNGVRDNLVAALGILHAKAGLQPLPYELGVRGLHFHKEDKKTTHRTCPGKNMVKDDLIKRVQAYIVQMNAGEHKPAA